MKQEMAAIYCRLSVEDREKDGLESESIRNQKTLLLEYAARQGWEVYDIYADEDYSSKTLRDYYRYANQCVYRSLDLDTCSYVVSSRADNMLSIAEAAVEEVDMPVFYGARDELLKSLKQRVKKASLKYIFSNAKPLGI